jgi:hypothetical protein
LRPADPFRKVRSHFRRINCRTYHIHLIYKILHDTAAPRPPSSCRCLSRRSRPSQPVLRNSDRLQCIHKLSVDRAQAFSSASSSFSSLVLETAPSTSRLGRTRATLQARAYKPLTSNTLILNCLGTGHFHRAFLSNRVPGSAFSDAEGEAGSWEAGTPL